ncbi:uncharacterized protein PHALS_07028 [Plasmopara halstedii]|uniref:RxLR-like protein n=1 Tax=Plasmopara halstedii TaxID=4781 RepID=A0A0P1B3F4_PLAHL|nr:uncharacterized protein PHALS_07028 [Plasmopara halstedii]CEG49256.1 hypothetical protein PHALS_07028 [Plasmopara halstedii]|eukprot:XP_024585625.1 hypothetical protein PHALS_07028 [Plasmopara halstedii]
MKHMRLLNCFILLSTFALLSFYDTEAVEVLASNAAGDETYQNSRRLLSTTATHDPNLQKVATVLGSAESAEGKLKPIASRIWNRIKNIELGQKIKKMKLKKNLKATWLFFMSIFTDSSLLRLLLPSVYLKYAGDKSAAIQSLFKQYDVGSVTSNVFASSQFKKWFAVISKAYKSDPQKGYVEILKALITKFGRMEIYMYLAEASNVPSMREIGKVLDVALIKDWIRMDVRFLLSKQDFQEWFFFRSKEGRVAAIELLLLKMKESGNANRLDTMLESAKIKGREDDMLIARIVRLVHLKSAGLSDVELFEKSGLDNLELTVLLTTEELFDWYDLVKMKGGDPVKILLPKLLQESSEEDVALLLAILAKLYDHPLTKTTLNALLSMWKESSTVSQVANHLHIIDFRANLFESEEMYVFDSYMQLCHGDDRYNSMDQELRRQFGDDFDKMLVEGVKSGNVIAKNLYEHTKSV